MITLTDDARKPFVIVPHPRRVIVGVQKREDFDRIAVPMVDHGENKNGHVLSKTVEGGGATQVTVVFHYWLKTLTTEELLAEASQ